MPPLRMYKTEGIAMPSVLYFCQIFFCLMDGNCTIGSGGDDLPQTLGPHITHGIHTGDIGGGGFAGQNIAVCVQMEDILDKLRFRLATNGHKDAVAGDILLSVYHDLAGADLRQRAVSVKFHIFRVH